MSAVSKGLRQARAARERGETAMVEELEAAAKQVWEASSTPADEASNAHSLASYYRDTGQRDQAENFARAAVKAERVAGRDALLGNHLLFLAQLLAGAGRHAEAVPLAQEALPCYQRCLGEAHAETLRVAQTVAQHVRWASKAPTS